MTTGTFRKLIAVSAMVILAAPFAHGLESYPIKLETREDNVKCFVCHDRPEMKERLADGKLRSYFVDPDVFSHSTHADQTCTACHRDIKQIPHEPGRKVVNCTGCHYIDNIYGAPTAEADVERYEKYRKSVHKKALDEGNPDAPNCYDCHGTHDIASPSRDDSNINRKNIPKTCGRCHLDEYTKYKTSVHGKALDGGNREAAVCIDCHGEHGTEAVHERGSSVNAATLPETCAQCHGEEKLMSRFGIDTAQYATYRESYHGKANRFGVQVVANCASCHGYHDVLPAADPDSSINPKKLPETCGKCHRGANINYTKGRMHVEPSDPSSGIIYWVALAFKILTFGTIAALVAHILLDLLRRILNRGKHGH